MPLRDYDPAIGRWVVLDPVIHHSQSPYSGFNGNPIVFADPSGGAGQQMLDRTYEDHEANESSFFSDNSNLFEGEETYDGGGASSEFGVYEEGSGFAICPTCPNTKEFDKYIKDQTNVYFYDPESKLVSLLLEEVVLVVELSEDRWPDFYTLNVSVAIPNPFTLTLLGWNGTFTIDRYGQIFFSPFGFTVGKSTTVLAGSITANTLQQNTTPTAEELANFLTGHGISVSAGFIWGHNYSYSPTNDGTKSAFGFGLFSPQIGASYNYTPASYTNTKK